MLNRKRFLKLVNAFPKSTVAVLGDLMLDEWIWGKVSRISPEAPVPVVQVEKRTFTPGGASNVAANLRSLGAKTIVAGVTGNDDAGRILRRELKSRGAVTEGVIRDKGRPTTLKTRIIAHNQQVVRADVERREILNGNCSRKLTVFLELILKKVDAFLFSDYNKGFLASDFIPEIVKAAIREKKIVVAGAKPATLFLFKEAALLVLNQSEAEQAAGLEIHKEKDLEKCGEVLLNRFKSQGVLITRGEHGMALFEKGKKPVLIPAHASQVYDVSGAGDTVAAVATLALVSGGTFSEAAWLANLAAGVVVKKVGTATVSPEELKELL